MHRERHAGLRIDISGKLSTATTPFRIDGDEWLLEVVSAVVKPKRVWIKVIEPARDERFRIRPRHDELVPYREATVIIEEAEERLRKPCGGAGGQTGEESQDSMSRAS